MPIPPSAVSRDIVCVDQWSYIRRIFVVVDDGIDSKMSTRDFWIVDHILAETRMISKTEHGLKKYRDFSLTSVSYHVQYTLIHDGICKMGW